MPRVHAPAATHFKLIRAKITATPTFKVAMPTLHSTISICYQGSPAACLVAWLGPSLSWADLNRPLLLHWVGYCRQFSNQEPPEWHTNLSQHPGIFISRTPSQNRCTRIINIANCMPIISLRLRPGQLEALPGMDTAILEIEQGSDCTTCTADAISLT